MVFLEEFFEKVDFEKTADDKKEKKNPKGQRVKCEYNKPKRNLFKTNFGSHFRKMKTNYLMEKRLFHFMK